VIFAPDWNLDELAELESRELAHLEGLRVGAGHSVDLARAALLGDQASAATAAALVLMDFADAGLGPVVFEALSGGADASVREGVRVGLRHCGIDTIRDALTELAERGAPADGALAADVPAFHRLPVRDVECLPADESETVRALAGGAMGRLGILRAARSARGGARRPGAVRPTGGGSRRSRKGRCPRPMCSS
jgi:hypothetical protein